MEHTQILVLALANVPTIITVLIGILLNSAKFDELDDRMTSIEYRMSSIEYHLAHISARLDAI